MALGVITPTQLIYQAAQKTPKVDVAMGKVVEYSGVDLIPVEDEICWLCGGETGGMGQPTKKAIKSTFTDHDKAKAPHSQSICPGCAWCLSFMSLRNYSILATRDALLHPTRPEIRNLLLDPPDPPFVFCIAVSGQKWLHFKTRVAYSRDNYPVQLEDTGIAVNRIELANILRLVEQMYTVFTKDEIRTGKYGQNRMKQFGIGRFQELEEQVSRYRGTRLFDLGVFVAQKIEIEPKEEGETACITTSIPKTTERQLQLF